MAAETPRNNRVVSRGRPFAKGNPGRPRGSRHKVTLLTEKLMQADAKAIVETVLTAARAGDMTAARIVLDRIAPASRDRSIRFAMPPVSTADDTASAMSAILAAVASGDLTPIEGQAVASLLEGFRKTLELAQLEQRILALESRETTR
jgi:hypothetical protein